MSIPTIMIMASIRRVRMTLMMKILTTIMVSFVMHKYFKRSIRKRSNAKHMLTQTNTIKFHAKNIHEQSHARAHVPSINISINTSINTKLKYKYKYKQKA